MNAITHGLSFDAYAKAEGVNASLLCELLRSAAHCRHAMLSPEQEPTAAMKLGTLVHRFVLESEKALDRLVCRPIIDGKEMTFRTNAGKAWRDGQTALGNTIIDRDERDQICGMVQSILSHPVARNVFESGQSEVSLFADWQGKLTRKARLDHIPAGNVIADIKTTTDASPRAFQKTVGELCYHLRAAYYLDIARELGLEKTAFWFVAVEKTPPYPVAVYELDILDVQCGRDLYHRLLDRFVECLHADKWPAYSDAVEIISLPEWARRAA